MDVTLLTVYLGRDNDARVQLYRFSQASLRDVPLDTSAVTRMLVTLVGSDPLIQFDSDLQPAAVTWNSSGLISFDLSDYAIQAGGYPIQIVAFSPARPDGEVISDFDLSPVAIQFRGDYSSGVTPPPLVQFVPEAPEDGQLYGRRNATWEPIDTDDVPEGATNHYYPQADEDKLAGVEAGATANQTDAYLRDRANHTGTQPSSTIAAFGADVRAEVEAELVAGANVTITSSGTGATRQLTIAATDVSASWGGIGGTLADQTDLVAALAEKVDTEAGKGLSSNDFTTAEKSKLAGIESGAQVNAAAVSQAEAEAGTGTALRSWTVQRVWQAIAAWWAASAMKTKLDGIATGATANSADAELRDRSTHTGTQAASTISDLAEVTQDTVSAMMVAGTNVTLSYDDTAGTLTVNASGGGSGGAVDSVNGQTGAVDLDAGDVGAEYPLTAGSNITIDRSNPLVPVISSTGSGTGIEPESIEASEALSAGHYVNLFNDGGTLKARKAGGSGKHPAHGFVKAAFSAAATAAVYPLAANNDALTGLSVGVTCYLSTITAGAVQLTAPNSSGVLRQELGVGLSATELLHTHSLAVELV